MRRAVSLDLRGLHAAGLTRPLMPVVMFEVANVSTTLLILRASDLLAHGGRGIVSATSLAVLLYAGHNAVAAGASFAAGHWIDRAGRLDGRFGGHVDAHVVDALTLVGAHAENVPASAAAAACAASE